MEEKKTRYSGNTTRSRRSDVHVSEQQNREEGRKKRRVRRKKNYKYVKYKIYAFSGTLLLLALIALIIPLRPKESKVEKRTLTKFPSFSIESFMNGEFLNGVSTWYADTFPFREKLLAANTKIHTAYGFQGNQIHGSIDSADTVPTKRVSITDIISPDIQKQLDEMNEEMKVTMATEAAVNSAGSGKKRREITQKPEQIGAVYVADDTGFSLYGFTQEAANQYIDAISAMANKVPGDVTVYDIVVPTSTAIYLDESLQKELGCSDQKESINYIYDNMDKKVVTVDAFSTLKKHSDDYLYFRTDHHWTALGAYYTYTQLMKEMGKTPTSLADYETVEFDGFIGSLYSSSNQAPSLAANPDTVIAYKPVATNDMKFTDRDGNTVDYDIIYDVSDWNAGSKYNCFIGGDQPLAEIHNPKKSDGSACVLIKESFGNAFAPFLVDNYEYVYVVDYRYYPEGLLDLVVQKNIKDVIFLNNIAAATTSSLVSDIEEIVNY